ncbi:MAG: hypothetical protein KC800_01895 [Candidatus Eremiobacteraeota bacterium]|nr:hypothetical protein [Candidatus Eremiobacteraeota bacterium]
MLAMVSGLTGVALAGVPGGNSNVNVNINTDQVNVTEVTQVSNDVILESLWKIVGTAWRENKHGKIPPPKHWTIELTVSDADFASTLADVKSELYDLAVVPGRKNAFSFVEDGVSGEEFSQISQSYEEVMTGSSTETESSFDANGATFGVDYIGDPGDYSTWIAIGPNDVNIDVNQVTTTTQFIDAITTTEYSTVAVWSVTGVQTVSPLLLDMDGDGAIQASGGEWLPHRTLNRDRMAFFDFHGDKFPVLMEWPGPQDGILCEPQSDGKIDGTNLFGTSTGYTNGYEALRVRDIDDDGKVQGEELSGLAVWTDLNSDARPQEGEVRSLRELGITELGVKHKEFVSHYVRDGKSQRMFDWWPQTYELNRVKLMPKKS